jgi:dihydroorotase
VGNSISGDPARVLNIYRKAALKGILLDVGHGSASFSYPSARIAVEGGIKPYTISTDLHKRSLPSHARSLAWVMSKMLACGLSVDEVVADVTTHPAGIVGELDWGLLEVGKVATLTVFEVETGSFDFADTGVVSAFSPGGREPVHQSTFSGDKCFRPRYAIWGGNVVQCGATG